MFDPVIEFLKTIPWYFALPGGVALLLGGGHWLVEGSVDIARRIGVSTLLIGLTVVAFGTSAPELSFNILAAVNDNGDLSFGNVVGSNIANIAMVLGITALLAPLVVSSRVLKKELPLLIAVSAAMLLLALLPPPVWLAEGARTYAFTWIDGVVLIAGFLFFSWLWYRMGRRDRADTLSREAEAEARDESPRSIPFALLLFTIGLAGLLVGGKLTEVGAVEVATVIGASRALVGLTIVAFATSLPELITSIMACRKGHSDLAIGNVVGSNFFNILLVLGITATVRPIAVPGGRGWIDLLVMLGFTLVLLPIAATGQRRITRLEGGLLLAGYIVYIVLGATVIDGLSST